MYVTIEITAFSLFIISTFFFYTVNCSERDTFDKLFVCPPSDVVTWLLYVAMLLVPITLCCCSGLCYALYKHRCKCDEPREFCFDWMVGSLLCCLYCIYQSLKPKKDRCIHIELDMTR